MQMRRSTYSGINNELYEIFLKFWRHVSDMNCQLLRFQIYYKDITFACDTIISDELIARYELLNEQVERICLQKIYRALDYNLNEYCSIKIGIDDVESRSEFS